MLDMWNPWEIYDRLIEQVDPSVRVSVCGRAGKWAFVENSEAGAGMAFHMPVESVPRSLPEDVTGLSLDRKSTRSELQSLRRIGFEGLGV